MMNKNKGLVKKKKRHRMVTLFSLVSLLILLYLGWLQLLPHSVYFIIVASVGSVVILFNFIDRFKFFSQSFRFWERILSFLLSIVLIVSSAYVYKFHSSLQLMVSLSKYSVNSVHVIVPKESAYKNLKDLENKKIGVSNANEIKDMQEYVEDKIKTKVNFSEVKNFEVLTLFKMLEEGKIDALLVDDISVPLIKEYTDKYGTDYHSIYQVDRKIAAVENTKKVDVTKKPFNVYISGIDTFGNINKVSRSDVNILLSINPQTHEILLVNTPRDYYVKSACQSNKEDKLTHCGSYGIQCSIDTLENLYGIDINYYLKVNFSSVEKIVDALGGVDMEITKSFCFEGDCLKQGMQHLDGKQTLLYSRERHSLENGEEDRGHNQQKVIEALIKKASSKEMIFKADKLLKAMDGSIETNMSVDSMLSLIQFQLTKSPEWSISMSAVTGKQGNKVTASTPKEVLYVLLPDRTSVDQVKAQFAKIQGFPTK